MAQTAPAPLCTLILPNGKRCGSPALRGKRFCYHHTGNHREFTRDRRLAGRLDRLNSRLNGMDTAELLFTLHQQLGTLPKTLSRFPEITTTLNNALGRLKAITTLESMLYNFTQRNQQFAGYVKEVIAESTTLPQTRQNQRSAPRVQTRPLNQINTLPAPIGSNAGVSRLPGTRPSSAVAGVAPQALGSA